MFRFFYLIFFPSFASISPFVTYIYFFLQLCLYVHYYYYFGFNLHLTQCFLASLTPILTIFTTFLIQNTPFLTPFLITCTHNLISTPLHLTHLSYIYTFTPNAHLHLIHSVPTYTLTPVHLLFTCTRNTYIHLLALINSLPLSHNLVQF